MFGIFEDSDSGSSAKESEKISANSYLFVPIFIEKDFWGFIGFEDCKTARKFDTDEVDALHTVAKNIGFRLNKENSIVKLEEEKFRFITENSKDLISQHGSDGTFIYLSPASMEILGFTSEECLVLNNRYRLLDKNI